MIDLEQKIKNLPKSSGVYLMKNKDGEIVYIGKAKSLINRVRSYFHSLNSKDTKTKKLVTEIKDFDIFLTRSENESIVLERNLIRTHQPHFNILLKDGKEYPYLRINFQEEWPRLEKVRRRKDDGALYLGPYSNLGSLYHSLKTVLHYIPIVRCSRSEFKNAKRPCNYYHIKKCDAPCVFDVDRDAYVKTLRKAAAFLTGKDQSLQKMIQAKMENAAKAENFEEAVRYRDKLIALKRTSDQQDILVKNTKSADIFAIAAKGEDESRVKMGKDVCVHVSIVRDRKHMGGENFFVTQNLAWDQKENFQDFLRHFLFEYYECRDLPETWIMDPSLKEHDKEIRTLAQALTDQDRADAKRPKIFFPERGEKHALLEQAKKNAAYHTALKQASERKAIQRLESLQKICQLETLPRWIESFDISHIAGTDTVAVSISYKDARPDKENYRVYNLRSIAEGETDDYQSMREACFRRFKRAAEEEIFPDLVVIDGGKGQLHAAMAGAEQAGVAEQIHLVALAKARTQPIKDMRYIGPQAASYERLFLPHKEEPIVLKPGSDIFRILTEIRDKTHDFAVRSHQSKRERRILGPKASRKKL